MFRPERLIKQRKKKKLTQEELAYKVNTSKGTISNYENEHSTPPHETLVSIADVLNVSTDYLLGRTDNPGSLKENSDDSAANDESEFLIKMREIAAKRNMSLNDPRFLDLVDIAFEVAGRVSEKKRD